MKPAAGSCPAAASAPISLSIALWRPTSSRAWRIAPVGRGEGGGVGGAGRAAERLVVAQRGERGEDRGFGRACACAATGGSGRATASRFSIPHSPHELSATRARTRSVSCSMPRPVSVARTIQPLLDFGDGDVGQVGGRFRQPFGQREAEREILEVARASPSSPRRLRPLNSSATGASGTHSRVTGRRVPSGRISVGHIPLPLRAGVRRGAVARV